MTLRFVPTLQQSSIAAGTAESWRFRRATVLEVLCGRVWVTLDAGSDRPDAPRGGDWFLDAGMSIALAPRQRAVLEPVGAAGQPAVVAYGIRSKSAASSTKRWNAAAPSSSRNCSLGGSPSAVE